MSNYIDVRRDYGVGVSRIVFADPDDNYVIATQIVRKENGVVAIEETDEQTNGDDVRIINAEHGRNLIKAIEKSIELGWLS